LPPEDVLYYLVGVHNAKFRRSVEPGDQLVMTVRIERMIRGIWCFGAKAEVDGAVAVSAEIRCAAKEVGA